VDEVRWPDVEAQAARLQEEGHVIEPGRGKKSPKVKDFEKHLVELGSA